MKVSQLNGLVSCIMDQIPELSSTYVPALVRCALEQNRDRGTREDVSSVSVFGMIGIVKLRAASCTRATMIDNRRTRILIE